MQPTPARPRLQGIDLVRGLVMFIMVLDHVRDFLSASAVNPRNVQDPALFLTRWITHFCAPTFVLLAGVSAFLFGQRGHTKRQLSRFLFTRGLWLVVIELTVVRIAWTFDVVPGAWNLQVIWAIGWSMVALSGLVLLPRAAIAAVAIVLVFGHDLLDGIHADRFGNLSWLWNLVHERKQLSWAGFEVYISYPLVPWIGVLAAGYLLGPLFLRPAPERARKLVLLGVATIGLFLVLRGWNLYGDPAPRVAFADMTSTALSFLNCEKYPPSLLYLAMTLGPMLVLLAFADRASGPISRGLITIGRVPLLFYVAHIYLVHTVAVAYALLAHTDVVWLFTGLPTRHKPTGYGLDLAGVYAVWLGIVIVLFPLCSWFAGLKQRRKDWWLSYL